jgi:hypothetical protein
MVGHIDAMLGHAGTMLLIFPNSGFGSSSMLRPCLGTLGVHLACWGHARACWYHADPCWGHADEHFKTQPVLVPPPCFGPCPSTLEPCMCMLAPCWTCELFQTYSRHQS